MITPIASYRLQLTPALGFREAIGWLDHLGELGVSHLYVSPIGEAIPESSHGYDVVDPTTVRVEFGGTDGLMALLDALAERGMALLIDHVPNHVAVTRPRLNPAWWEMLRDGPDSPGAQWFDVDRTADQRVILPILGEPLDDMLAAGRIRIADDVVVIDDAVELPVAAGTAALPLDEALDRQHYRLQWWRSPQRNVRRFFTIDDLVAVRVEVPEVVQVIDSLPERIATHPAFGGLRIDHLDGLADPAGYLDQLRHRIGGHSWLVVEKILARDEELPTAWPADGTTGYEFARVVDHLVLDPAAEPVLDDLWTSITADPRPFHEIEDRARREVLAGGLRPDLERTVAAAARAFGDLEHLEESVLELTVGLPRYRTYLPHDPGGREVLRVAARDAARAAPRAAGTIDVVVGGLLDPATVDEHAFLTRWQQLTGPAMAKGAEDRAFYRYLRLASTCEVGGDPGSFGVTTDEFHAHNARVAAAWPLTMLAASTHDTKRSDAVRCRSAALTTVADSWAEHARRWTGELTALVPGLPPSSALLGLQTVVTCPGLDPTRLTDYLVKAAREADLHTSWTDPDTSHEHDLADAARVLTGGSNLARDVATWAENLDTPGRRAAVVTTVLRMTSPGVPDIYQGTETPSFRLVDPDNRVPPDLEELRAVLARAQRLDPPTAMNDDPDATTAAIMMRALQLRRRRPEAFAAGGGYTALEPTGPRATSFVAFGRSDTVIVVVAVAVGAHQPGAGEERAALTLPPGAWRNVFDDTMPEMSGELVLDDLLDGFPAMVLEPAR
jgi:(1->4)-alpha-D-glucan 1-alpha-D-glucosylmutase